jgi:hypothetical protein
MWEPNASKILSLLNDGDVVLDIGGWARPFNRANYVMDAEPYETRGYFSDPKLASVRGWYGPPQGGVREWFGRDTWIQRDLCDRESFPFKDKEIDFAVCSQTLEDLRDPPWVCSEMIRVAKQGYIEVPARLAESSRGIEPHQVGWSHHRWLVDIVKHHIYFTMKYHMIHSHWRFSLPYRRLCKLPEEKKIQWLFWDGSFGYSEVVIHTTANIAQELERFVREQGGYPSWLLETDRAWRNGQVLASRVINKVRREFGVRFPSKAASAASKSKSLPKV